MITETINKEIAIKYYPRNCKHFEGFSFDVTESNGFNSASFQFTNPLSDLSHFEQLKQYLLEELTPKNDLNPTNYSIVIDPRTIRQIGEVNFKILESIVNSQNRWESA